MRTASGEPRRTTRRARSAGAVVGIAALLGATGCGQEQGPAETYLWVVTAEGGTIAAADGGALTLTLEGVVDVATQFADRPFRDAYVLPTAALAAEWGDLFGDDSPNGALAFTSLDGGAPQTVVLELSDPVHDAASGTLVFTAVALDEEAQAHPAADGAVDITTPQVPDEFAGASLFVDGAGDRVINGCVITPDTRCAGANLSGARLADASLSGADLTGADLSKADLRGTDLTGANLTGANLTGAKTAFTRLAGADLTGVIVTGTSMQALDLTGATIEEGTFNLHDLSTCTLTDVDMSGWNLARASFSSTTMIRTNLSDADLTRAWMARAQLIDADLSGAQMSGAILNSGNLTGANLRGANLSSANLTSVLIERADFTGANLRGAKMGDTYPDDTVSDATTTCPDGSHGPCW
jgi:uncharacterized protein YjbI with pentapeptide repeats